jgi:hypothetical protein
MRVENIRHLAERCRTLASNADIFTKKRLEDLALRYEAMLKECPDSPSVVSVSMKIVSQPISIQSVTIQSVDRTDQ